MSSHLVRSHGLFLNIFLNPRFSLCILHSFMPWPSKDPNTFHNNKHIFALWKKCNLSIFTGFNRIFPNKKDTSHDVSFLLGNYILFMKQNVNEFINSIYVFSYFFLQKIALTGRPTSTRTIPPTAIIVVPIPHMNSWLIST